MVDQMELERIRCEATRFRDAMDRTLGGEGTGRWLKGFPRECCDRACILLRRFLREKGFGEFDEIAGTHLTDDVGHHHWLRKDDVDVDITGDQFGQPRVIVTRKSHWHQGLKGTLVPPSDSESDDAAWNGMASWVGYGAIYDSILANLDDSKQDPQGRRYP